MSDIFKIIYLEQTNIKKMVVFFGNKKDIDVKALFTKDKENALFDGVFSKDQLDRIIKDNIDVVFSKQIIYIDDTIETIKKKIMTTFNVEYYTEIAFDEIYLFSKQIQMLRKAYVKMRIYSITF